MPNQESTPSNCHGEQRRQNNADHDRHIVRRCYGHTREGAPPEEWEPLETHLTLVADRASQNAAEIGASKPAYIAGLLHDLGKYSAEFQAMLRAANGLEAGLETHRGKIDHSTAGAQYAASHFSGSIGRMLAYCIAGHHGGLPDATDESGGASGLNDRLKKSVPSVEGVPLDLLDLLEQEAPPMPRLNFGKTARECGFRLSVLCRMLFSCLVDADFLATEQYMNRTRAAERSSEAPNLDELLAVLDDYLKELQSRASETLVNHQRREVLEACRRAAEMTPGLFSLTVPTGGGKTLSSLAFALKHAVRHGLRRVIYAIPFTSIIEQNADVFRKALKGAGLHAVLEHHSNFESERETCWSRFAAENWDAPVIVTTNVQLYESLFANKPGRCRKLHNIARSVIVLDEVQTLPVRLLRPTLAMLAELCRNYGCTVVLCSATQPAVTLRDDFPIGLEDVQEIINEPPALFEALKRVEVELLGTIEDAALVERLVNHEQALCIVNTRAHAKRLYELTEKEDADGVFHLSAQMCPAHRAEILNDIKDRLVNEQTCRVVSTQLIEAGVDIDFPIVYRAAAGLDAIAQAAGRCNREGKRQSGSVFVFEADIPKLMYEVRLGAQNMREVSEQCGDSLLGLEAIERYFSLHYWQRQDEWDQRDIMPCFSQGSSGPHFQFRQAAERYRLIDQTQQSVVVPYGETGRLLIDDLKLGTAKPSRALSRRLQRYVVGVYDRQMNDLRENGVIAQYHDQYWVLEDERAYDARFGLRLDAVGRDPEGLIY